MVDHTIKESYIDETGNIDTTKKGWEKSPEHLWDNWQNGNLTYVADKVAKMKRSEILDLVWYITNQNNSDLWDDILSLRDMLQNRNR